MAKYTGKSVTLPRDIDSIYSRVSDLSGYKSMLDELPADQRERIHGITFDADSVAFDAPGVGRLSFKLAETVAPTHVAFRAEQSPIPLNLCVDLKAESADSTLITPSIDIELPAMLRSFVGPKLQEAADKFGEVFSTILK
ncbi:MAG: hypothetical protein HDR83_08230 [Bacteroides sp.]|nr:hypothetical protein [Bacteroidales bacterium]MBD5251078.1 hypothetical protein [Barnesiella sp.]MBD5253025.1 hypothetical protein [Barnesiella sp.]MBD5345235.1 hypothetical protein [Bacteroides sp.]MBD5369227.1 hypothetical protein [Bacteroides sp.]